MTRTDAEQIGIITNIQFFCTNDGPGIRTTVFLKGCRINCRWCHNPEGKRKYPEVFPYYVNCNKCGKCIRECPTGAISMKDDGRLFIDKGKCIVCLRCVEVCDQDAMHCYGKIVTVKEVLEEVEKDKPFYINSGGGMTVSGGEPLTQPVFLESLLKCAKEKEISTALDTCGFAAWDDMDKVTNWTDLVLYDIKGMDPVAHKDWCGVTNEVILNNAKKIVQKGIKMQIRVPIIEGVNDNLENMKKTAEFVAELNKNDQIIQVDLLPFHPYAGAKYRLYGLDYNFPAGEGYSEERLMPFVEVFNDYGLDVTIGG